MATASASGPLGVVRRNSHGVGFGGGGNFAGFPQTAHVRQVGLNDVAGSLLKNLTELVTGDQPLAGGNGNPRGAG